MESIVFWLVLMIVFLAVEAATLGLTTIWFAGGALTAVLAALLKAPLAVQIVLFFAVSLALLFFTRPIALKYFNKGRIRTNVESLVGKKGIVTGEIDNLHGVGQVTVNGLEWSARSFAEGQVIPKGAVVTVMAINGVKLIVRKDEVPAKEAEKGAGEPAQAQKEEIPEEDTSDKTT